LNRAGLGYQHDGFANNAAIVHIAIYISIRINILAVASSRPADMG
jgi:hypothetical protein